MRQVESFGSVKAISLNRDECVQRLRQVAEEALKTFPELLEVRLFGSLATGTHTGTSSVDKRIEQHRRPRAQSPA